ncbi:MAG: c-type cytochrome [Nitrospirae bacterium]|nr:c-type cytochrome [Nitrospirota bacterium]
MRRFLILSALLILLPFSAFSEDKGKQLYDQWCAQCHGYQGDAESYARNFTNPKPRDFAFGVYKFRSTPSGKAPTDEDIIRSIRKGNPGTSMPAWKRFSDEEVKAITEHVKKFAPDTFAMKGQAIKIGKAPSCGEDTIKKGKEVYKSAKCFDCHGDSGRGNGQKGWDEKFKDDWGEKIYPANLTHPWEMRNGASPEDLYRTITTGLSGTPMTSYMDSIADEQRWQLACYITSIQLSKKLGVALPVKKVSAIPSDIDDKMWDSQGYLDIPLGGQIMFEPRNFIPSATNVRVRGVYTEKEAVLLVEWSDKKPNKGDDGMPVDSAIVQVPSKLTDGADKPYFFRGTDKAGVALYQWKSSASDAATELNAKGVSDIKEQERQDIKASGSYNDGTYRVIFRRPLNTGDQDDIVFDKGKFIPFSVTLYDGQNTEDGSKGAVSAWYYLMLEPETPMKVYILPPVVSLIVLGVGIGLHKKLKKG